jgi:hypothetical protein
MPDSTDVAGVRRILSMVTYLAQFLPQISAICELPLQALTRQDAEWKWTAQEEEAFEKMRQAVSSIPAI